MKIEATNCCEIFNVVFVIQLHNVDFKTEAENDLTEDSGDGAKAITKCPIPIQKETPTGLVDTICKNDVPAGHAGMCRLVCLA